MDPLTKEYNDFMEWFIENHPEYHEKYGRNISIPFQIGGGITVNNNYALSQEEFDILYKLVQTYYYTP